MVSTIAPATDGVLHLYLFFSYFIFKAFRVPDLGLDELPLLQARYVTTFLCLSYSLLLHIYC
jgi:hypothetical protein